ncbi:MAG: hypothetical protein M1835_007634 [Candelina submexicana]|nr:MAG: hypothetical protein M1835_007634 [Candelina submexicana]
MVAVLRPRKVARKNESTIQRQERLLHRHISPHWGRQRSANLRSQGMPNWNGVLCYRHSGLQGLLHVPKFVNWLEQEHTGDSCAMTNCLACALRSLSEVYWWSPPPTSDIQREAIRKALKRIDVVASRLGWYTSTRRPNQHQDAEEQIRWLLLTLQNQLPHAASSTLSSLFTINLLSTITCADRTSTRRKCGHRSTKSETQLNLQLNIPPPATSNNAHPRLTSYITTSLNETLTSYTCASCASTAPKRRIYTITNAAPILIVQQKRFTVNPYTGRTSKLMHHVAFSEWLDLSSHADDASEEVKYRLVSVVDHAGGLGAGHYKTLAKGPDTKWRDINDDVVRGGTVKDAVQPGGKWTPYLLIYERVERYVAS